MLALALAALVAIPASSQSPNSLRLGGESRSKETVKVPLVEPAEFDGKTRGEILSLRREAVEEHPELYKEPYEPYEPIFGQIADERPWWGEDGLFFYSWGEKSIEGRSERSRVILNPFLLIDGTPSNVPFIERHHLSAGPLLKAKASDPGFSYFPKLSGLVWDPRARRAEVTYRVSDFLAFIAKRSGSAMRPEELEWDFRTANARDWGFEYSYLDPEASPNLVGPGSDSPLNRNRDFFHLGGTCRYPGGCNNLSPRETEISDYRVTGLPARARFLLWRKAPSAVTAEPDFTFDIRFK